MDSIFGQLGFRRVFDGIIENAEKLLQRRVVHPVYLGHFHNAEVKNSTSSSYWSKELSFVIDFCLFNCGFRKFVVYFLRFSFDSSEYINEFCIIKKRTLGAGKTRKKLSFIRLESFCVTRHIFLQLC
jgi:hypothetical protein